MALAGPGAAEGRDGVDIGHWLRFDSWFDTRAPFHTWLAGAIEPVAAFQNGRLCWTGI